MRVGFFDDGKHKALRRAITTRTPVRWALVCVSLVATLANAQSHEGRSLQINTGAGGLLRDKDYRTNAMPAADAMFSARVSRSIRWGISASIMGDLGTTDDCVLRISTGECLPRSPEMVMTSLLIGRVWQLGSASSGFSIRSYAGPSFVHLHYRSGRTPEHWSTVGGGTGRLEFVKQVATRLDLLLNFRATIVPGFPREGRGTHAFGFGIAVH
ncbi:MAG: hypothetical protein H7Z40_13360 [Phycisphaerae bacterium]|nr:hypothetical protein [Gemmatimonadaceae bacterium]